MKRVLTILCCTVLLSGHALSQTSQDNAKDNEGIRQVLRDFEAAWVKHDARAFSMVFSEDADFTNVRGMSAHGRTEVERFHAPLFAGMFKDARFTMTDDVRIRFLKPDVAAVDARWEMTGAKDPQGQDRGVRKGLLMFVMTRQEGQWHITIMHNMDLPVS